MIKNSISRAVGKLGYSITKQRPAYADLFNAACDYVNDRSARVESPQSRFVEHCLKNIQRSQSQRMQDMLADFVNAEKPGVFCEFGATNGKSLSNTYFLETERGWTGVLAEPGRNWHAQLASNRPNARIEHRCVYSVSGQMLAFNEAEVGEYSTIVETSGKDAHQALRRSGQTYQVETIALNDMLDAMNVTALDFLSVDTEGSELAILEPFDFARFRPKLIAVEHNYTDNRARLYDLIVGAGYRRVFEELSAFDDWYVRADQLDRLS